MTNTTNNNIGISKDKSDNPIKQAHRVSGKTLVIIDEKIVKQLDINENNTTWFEQIPTENGILLKKIRNLCCDDNI